MKYSIKVSVSLVPNESDSVFGGRLSEESRFAKGIRFPDVLIVAPSKI